MSKDPNAPKSSIRNTLVNRVSKTLIYDRPDVLFKALDILIAENTNADVLETLYVLRADVRKATEG